MQQSEEVIFKHGDYLLCVNSRNWDCCLKINHVYIFDKYDCIGYGGCIIVGRAPVFNPKRFIKIENLTAYDRLIYSSSLEGYPIGI
jgi:hypothetical protein